MCGIAGIHDLNRKGSISREILLRMVGMIQHRGPDQCGIYLDDDVGLAHARLSIIDLVSGTQPLHNEDETLWLVYNGEIFNYIELRNRLEVGGHYFHTKSDGEVILHLYEEQGADFLNELRGQFALAIWDPHRKELLLARDRCGIRPLYYTLLNNTLIFASEIKAIFENETISRSIDPIAIDQIFTFWTTLPGRSVFKGIKELPPGHYLRISKGHARVCRYWDFPLPECQEQWSLSLDEICDRTRAFLNDAIRLRLRADVPVGCYLSGGLDSSIVATQVARDSQCHVRTFGIRFEEADYDEGRYQRLLTSSLTVDHEEVLITNDQIGRILNKIIWHCEKPILRTAPAPLYLLSRLVRDSDFKVVLSGEGADEVFGGYNIFREAKVRRFLAHNPNSAWRGGLIGELYPYVFRDRHARSKLQLFFSRGLENSNDPLFSHMLRWDNTRRLRMFFSEQMKDVLKSYNGFDEIRNTLPEAFCHAHPLIQAQYLEMKIFLSNYLLSSQGDRMAMAHSVEIRMPYMDHHLIEFASRIPARWKILGLNEKFVLKRSYKDLLPNEITERSKQPYRAPIDKVFLQKPMIENINELLSEKSIEKTGLFDAGKVAKLIEKLRIRKTLSEMENMALVGILSTQSIYQQFVEDYPQASDHAVQADLIVDRRCSIEV